jgi:hypothetical protein
MEIHYLLEAANLLDKDLVHAEEIRDARFLESQFRPLKYEKR